MDRAVTLSISSTPVLYPNPSSGETVNILTSFYTGSSNIKIQVFTAAFRLVRGMTMSTTADGPIILDLRDNRGIPLANGLYYVSVKTKNSQSLMKLFVLR
jgi:hypothetical protein